jgi:GH24 family phage-related lysozyme (muramidase)
MNVACSKPAVANHCTSVSLVSFRYNGGAYCTFDELFALAEIRSFFQRRILGAIAANGSSLVHGGKSAQIGLIRRRLLVQQGSGLLGSLRAVIMG